MKEYNFAITAETARETATEYKQYQTERELKEVFDKIVNQVTLGSYSLILNYSLSPNVKQFLTQYGYKVTCGNQYNTTFTRIDW